MSNNIVVRICHEYQHVALRVVVSSWDTQRVNRMVEWHHGELYPRVGFIVTNMTRPDQGW